MLQCKPAKMSPMASQNPRVLAAKRASNAAMDPLTPAVTPRVLNRKPKPIVTITIGSAKNKSYKTRCTAMMSDSMFFLTPPKLRCTQLQHISSILQCKTPTHGQRRTAPNGADVDQALPAETRHRARKLHQVSAGSPTPGLSASK